ncbi:hypothetical protein K440DRAFT_158584 [Wilcoxina mikolae CBS 423.85]|nr:hypothetical protein K440DRAFT_158584 [Wilcoxina mikolae CBS 423.85]
MNGYGGHHTDANVGGNHYTYPTRNPLEDNFSGTTSYDANPRFNPMTNGHHHHNQKHASLPSKRSSENDDMSLHLLVEQAIYDSADYEILSYEEVEDLKKEHIMLTSRIDATKRKLVMESKVRDAAQSLSRLTSKKSQV